VFSSLFDLSGRTALVTGSSRGIGAALAAGLADAGARVVLNGRDTATLARARDELARRGGATVYARCTGSRCSTCRSRTGSACWTPT
jgi:gluconate 5-dehydrogenase